MALQEQFLSAIRSVLAERGLTPHAMALRAGISPRSFYNVLDGRTPSFEKIDEISDALGFEVYVGPPRGELPPALPPDTESHRWGDRRGRKVTPFDVPMREGHAPERVGFSPNGCATFGLEFLLEFDLDPLACEVIEIWDDSMAPELPAGAAGLVDLRRTERSDGRVFVLEAPELTVRRTVEAASGWIAMADNREYRSVVWNADVRIVGQVVWTSHMVGVEKLERAVAK